MLAMKRETIFNAFPNHQEALNIRVIVPSSDTVFSAQFVGQTHNVSQSVISSNPNDVPSRTAPSSNAEGYS